MGAVPLKRLAADAVTTLYDLTIEEIEFLALVRALPPERRNGLIATLHLIVDRFREQTGGYDLEPLLDG